jgi:hypothetical protein
MTSICEKINILPFLQPKIIFFFSFLQNKYNHSFYLDDIIIQKKLFFLQKKKNSIQKFKSIF